jgi:hypothetical protein
MSTYVWNSNEPATGGSGEWTPLPTDTYVMKIAEAAIEDDKFAQPDRDGRQPQKLVLTWEISKLSPEQQEAGIALGEKVWQRINPYFGTVKDGGPSKFMAFVQSLVEQKLLPAGDFTVGDFIGITQRVLVEEYTKTMGANVGKPGNRVASVAPLTVQRRQRPMVQPNHTPVKPLPSVPADDDDLGF